MSCSIKWDLTKNKGKSMNERIQKLAEQAKLSIPVNELTVPEWIEKYNQAFAELLLKDCIDICINGNATQMTSNGAAESIKLHFGIK